MRTRRSAMPFVACLVAIGVSAGFYRWSLTPQLQPARHVVASDGRGLVASPDADFVLVRSREEFRKALARKAERSGRLVLMADLESGPGLVYDFGPRFPAPGALGAVDDEELSGRVGEYYGQAFACAGFDMVLAPTTDLFKGNSAVGWRAVGSRPDRSLALLKALVRGIRRGGTIPVIKHYPGHGAANGDTHEAVATIELPWEKFESEDLRMFRELCCLPEVGGVMLGHLRGSGRPEFGWPPGAHELAMVSPFWMNLIRKSWGYEGLLVSDALVMKAAVAVPGGEAFCSSRFLDLGGDLLLGMSMESGAARRAVLAYLAYHREGEAITGSSARLDRMLAEVAAQRERNRGLNREEVLARGERLAREVACRSLLAAGSWQRPLRLETVPCYLAVESGPPVRYDPKEAVKGLGTPFAGHYQFDSDTAHSAALVMVYGYVSEPALTPAQIARLAERVRSGTVCGVIVCGWPGLVYELAAAGVPALGTWGMADACMAAAAEWLQGTAPAPGQWPYDPDLRKGTGW